MPRSRRARTIAAFVVLAACALRGAPAGAGVSVAVEPALVTVAPEEEFVVELSITEAGSSFNGFDTVVEYDPSRLTFLPATPVTQQQGALFTSACGNTFHRFVHDADSLAITSVLLCAGVSVTGPGPVYRLRFRAGSGKGSTWIRIRPTRTFFYAAGLYVLPVSTADGEVVIGDVTGVGDGAPSSSGLSLAAWPNPTHGGATIEWGGDVAGPIALSVVDARGRRVRSIAVESASGPRRLAWDGRDGRGRRAPAGTYTLRLVTRDGRAAAAGLVLLR